jgi:hydrogenase/urease accessory protein HupE
MDRFRTGRNLSSRDVGYALASGRILVLPMLVLFFAGSATTLLAHDPGLSTANIRLRADRVEAVLGFSIADTAEIVNLDKDAQGKISKRELTRGAAELKKGAPKALDVTLDGERLMPSDIRCEFDGNDNASIYLTFAARPFTNLVVRSKWLAILPPGHRQLVTVQDTAGRGIAERLLSANDDQITISMDPSDLTPAPARMHSFAEFLVMGIKHIWTGYDHLLFLFGLLVVSRNLGSSVKIITCFTLAHSITLAVATLSVITIPSRFIEPLIAVSIIYVGIENLIRGDDPKGRGLLAFAFGLIHGFGFASVLRELGVGSNGSGIAVPLVSFNLGVEVGQLAIAAVALPIIWKLRTKPTFLRRWVPACSVVVALLGGFWFVQRVWF